MKTRPQPVLKIPPSAWEEAGPDDDKGARLMATVIILGCFFHAEAFAVVERDGIQVPDASDFREQFDRFASGAEADGKFETTLIGKSSREYVIFLYPFC